MVLSIVCKDLKFGFERRSVEYRRDSFVFAKLLLGVRVVCEWFEVFLEIILVTGAQIVLSGICAGFLNCRFF